jgi:hypothetical protein
LEKIAGAVAWMQSESERIRKAKAEAETVVVAAAAAEAAAKAATEGRELRADTGDSGAGARAPRAQAPVRSVTAARQVFEVRGKCLRGGLRAASRTRVSSTEAPFASSANCRPAWPEGAGGRLSASLGAVRRRASMGRGAQGAPPQQRLVARVRRPATPEPDLRQRHTACGNPCSLAAVNAPTARRQQRLAGPACVW